MPTQNFRTKTMFIERTNVHNDNAWNVAVDVGYSGVKLFSPNIIACFPAFAVPAKGELIAGTQKSMEDVILYRESADAPVWFVGRSAQDTISKEDPDTSSMSIYGRQRYGSDMFRVLVDTALGIACKKNDFGNPDGLPVVLRTGLPNAYIKTDSLYLKEAFEGFHSFDLKIGNADWQHFDTVLAKGNVSVMPQPMGTLLSVVTSDDGTMRSEADLYYSSPTLICDPGFGTFDCFSLRGGAMTTMETFDTLGMKQVLADTSREIFEKYHTDIPVPAMQRYLETGFVSMYDRRARTSVMMPFDDILQECSRRTAMKAIDKLDEIYNLDDYRYLILTGGTGEAWYPYFKDAYKGMSGLTLIPGNQNTMGIIMDENGHPASLPFIFSNVRGYYMALCHK